MSELFKLHFVNSNEQHLDDLDLSSDIPVADMLPLILKELELDPTADWQLTLVDYNRAIDLPQSFEQAGARSGSTIRIQSGLQRIGRYELKRQLGGGGMGVVYEGYDPNLDQRVAIKIIKPEMANDLDMMQRFSREARAMSRLRGNVNVVQVYDFVYGQIENRPASKPVAQSAETSSRSPKDTPLKTPPFFVMEYVEGNSLSEYLEQRNSLPLQNVADILTPIAAGLDAAHQQGIIHRDLKPGNILLQPDSSRPGSWVPKIADFGLVRLSNDPGAQTKTGLLTGTPYYMSPEQIEGKALTPQTDIYSLGIVVYEMLTGRRPFQDGASTKILMDHLQAAPPPIRQFSSNIPAEVEKVVLKALSKKPEERYQSATAFAEDFKAAVTPPARPPKKPLPVGKLVLIAGIVFTLAIAATLIWVLTRPVMSSPAQGKIIFASTRDSRNSQIYMMNPDGSNQQRLTKSNLEERFPQVSADGTRLIFLTIPAGANPATADGKIYIVNLSTGERHPIDTQFANTRHASWNPTNEQELVFSAEQNGESDIYLFDLPTGSSRPLVQMPGADYYPAWSPDGQKITFTHSDGKRTQIYTINADGNNLQDVSNTSASDWLSSWSPDGSKIAFVSNRNGEDQVFLANADGTGQHALDLNLNSSTVSRPVWSPDGNKLAFEARVDNQSDIYSINVDGSNLTRLTNNPAEDFAPYWR